MTAMTHPSPGKGDQPPIQTCMSWRVTVLLALDAPQVTPRVNILLTVRSSDPIAAGAVSGHRIVVCTVAEVGRYHLPQPMIDPAVPPAWTRPWYSKLNGQFVIAVVVVFAVDTTSAVPATPPRYRPRMTVGVPVFDITPQPLTRIWAPPCNVPP